MEFGCVSSKATAISVDASTVSAISGRLTAKATIATSTRQTAAHGTSLHSAEFVAVGPRFLALTSDSVYITQELGKLLGPVAYVDTLVFAIHVYEMELAKHLEE